MKNKHVMLLTFDQVPFCRVWLCSQRSVQQVVWEWWGICLVSDLPTSKLTQNESEGPGKTFYISDKCDDMSSECTSLANVIPCPVSVHLRQMWCHVQWVYISGKCDAISSEYISGQCDAISSEYISGQCDAMSSEYISGQCDDMSSERYISDKCDAMSSQWYISGQCDAMSSECTSLKNVMPCPVSGTSLANVMPCPVSVHLWQMWCHVQWVYISGQCVAMSSEYISGQCDAMSLSVHLWQMWCHVTDAMPCPVSVHLWQMWCHVTDVMPCPVSVHLSHFSHPAPNT